MSYQVLARKWRPRAFGEMVGQEHVLQALINGLDNGRLHHAYLFTGTRGVGKTTLARIIARCLNCEQGVSSTPCGVCSACVAISEGRFVDLLEVDAASRTKVEDTRELLENVQYLPTSGRYKVYLIDEVHMLSNHSFNALLKTLEEPPPHVKFLLATTDPQKLPVTILSRCLQFNLKNLNPERIVGYLQHVLAEEKVPFEEPALWALGRAADGSMRDALSLTDQAIAHGAGQITALDVNAMLGAIDLSAIREICRAVAGGEPELALSLVDRLAEHAPDYSEALAEILSLWHRVAIAQTAPDALDRSHADHQTVLELAETVSREDVQLYYQITLLGRRDLPYAADPRSGFEMVLLRLLAFQPVSADYAEKPRLDSRTALEGGVLAKKPEPLQPDAAPRPPAEDNSPSSPPVTEQAIPQRPPESPVAESVAGNGAGQTGGADLQARPNGGILPSDADAPLKAGDVPPAGAVQSEDDTDEANRVSLEQFSPENWVQVYRDLPTGGLVQNTAANLVYRGREGDRLRFDMDRDNSTLYEEGHQDRLAQVLSAYFATRVGVEIRVCDTAGEETPRQYEQRIRAERQQAAVEALKRDPHVNAMIRTFAGELLEHTVRPVEKGAGTLDRKRTVLTDQEVKVP